LAYVCSVMWDAASGSHVWRSTSCQRLLRAYSVCAPGAPEAQTKYSRYVDAVRFQPQLSALRIIDRRNFFAKRKEVTTENLYATVSAKQDAFLKTRKENGGIEASAKSWSGGEDLDEASVRRHSTRWTRPRFDCTSLLAPLLRQLATAAAKWPKRAPGPVPYCPESSADGP